MFKSKFFYVLCVVDLIFVEINSLLFDYVYEKNGFWINAFIYLLFVFFWTLAIILVAKKYPPKG